jgi:peptidoglycan-N-acetylglucosamine deacetylase
MPRLHRAVRVRIRGLVRAPRPGLGGARRSLDPPAGTLALTFDDGPDPQFTPLVLDILADHRVAATFFVIGRQASAYPELVRRIVDEGHGLGTHSQSHPNPWALPPVELWRDYRDGRRTVESITGRPVRLFRPPKGYIDAVGAAAMRAARLRPWLWTVDSEDWRPGVTTGQLVAGLAGIGPGDIVLLHDGLDGPLAPEAADRSATVEALPLVVHALQRRGLRLVTLPP